MRLVVGLGNPGRQYENTRHNVGYEVLAELARRYGGSSTAVKKFESEVLEVVIGGEKILLMSPLTYMNLSGRAVGQCVRFYQLSLDRILIICDDMNIRLGQLRLRRRGSAGGQRGLNDIIRHLGTEDFPRLRIGIDRPPERVDPANFVLARFRSSERETVNEAVGYAADAVETWVELGLDQAMNRLNSAGKSK